MAEVSQRACVVVGRFNPAILVPDWLVKQGILPAGEVKFEQQFGGNLFRFHHAGLMWQASNNRLLVEAESPESDPGEFVAQVLEKLNHTPVIAVGNNFSYEVVGEKEAEKALSAVDARLRNLFGSGQYEPLGYSGTVLLSGVDSLVSITVDTERDGQPSISFNFERSASSATAAAQAARRFDADAGEAQRLLEGILR